MKVLLKNHDTSECSSLVIVSDPQKQIEMIQLLTLRNYAKAIKYLLEFGQPAETNQKGKKTGLLSADLVLTPTSVHWDLV
jgi:hypothetical protein